MTSQQVEIKDSDYNFGYYWWLDPVRNIHFMWGHGGQFAFIYPQNNIVVIITSIPNTQGDYEIQADEALSIVDKIIAASN
jgi:CubicO group peptidase (beta-lactamase class C family)